MKFPINPNDYDADTVYCPCCKNNYLHHTGVRVFDRDEDDENVVMTVVENNATSVKTIPSKDAKNPSARRHGIRISFWCEHCDTIPYDLVISQHKGCTFLGWEEK